VIAGDAAWLAGAARRGSAATARRRCARQHRCGPVLCRTEFDRFERSTHAVQPGDRLAALKSEAMRKLAGSAQLNCQDRPGGPVSVVSTESSLRFGGASYPIDAIENVTLSTVRGVLSISYDFRIGADLRSVGLSFDAFGNLVSASGIASIPFGGQASSYCTPTVPARWGTFNGNGTSFVDGIEKPRPSYGGATATCSYASPDRSLNATMSVSYNAWTLFVRDFGRFDPFTSSGVTWQDPNLVPGSKYATTLTLGDRLTTFWYRDDVGGPTTSIGVDTANAIQTATLLSGPTTLSCSR
jgi:hypothetical protein